MICCECDKELETHSHEYDGEPVCDDCWDMFCSCTNCSKVVYLQDTTEHGGDMWCDDCNSEYWYVCSERHCEAYVHQDDVRYVHDEPYCEPCFDRNYTYVECCDEAIRNDNVYWGGGVSLCEDHYNENYNECSGCSESFHNDDLYYNEEESADYCRQCNNNNLSNQRIIKPYEHKPRPKFEKLAYENTLFMGIELEVESPKDLQYEAGELKDYLSGLGLEDRFYFKWDGSVRDGTGNYSGFEIVSHPATLKWWHQSKAWYNMLKYLKKEGFSSYKTGRCGIHVHVNKSSFDDSQMRKLALFFWSNKEWLKIFAMRDSSGYASYEPYTLKQASKRGVPMNNRHVAVNFTNTSTIEFRIFRGTLNPERFLVTLQFVDALCHFVKMSSIMTCGKYCFREFMGFVANTNRYNNLDLHLRILDMKHNFDNVCNEVEM